MESRKIAVARYRRGKKAGFEEPPYNLPNTRGILRKTMGVVTKSAGDGNSYETAILDKALLEMRKDIRKPEFESQPQRRTVLAKGEHAGVCIVFRSRAVAVPRVDESITFEVDNVLTKQHHEWLHFKGQSAPEIWRGNISKNPLMDAEILKKLFKFVDKRDLRSVRKVCRLWYTTSLVRWRKENILKLTVLEYHNIPNCMSLKELHVRHSIAANDFYQLAKVPYRGFTLHNWEFGDQGLRSYSIQRPLKPAEILKIKERVKWFRKTFERNIECLSFSWCFFTDISTFLTSIMQFAPNTVKLKISIPCSNSLKDDSGNSDTYNAEVHGSLLVPNVQLKCLEISYRGESCEGLSCCQLPVPWFALMQCFPNLEALCFNEVRCFKEIQRALKAIKKIKKECVSKIPLKVVKILGSSISPHERVPLSMKNMLSLDSSIEHLEIDLGLSTEESFIKEVVRHHSSHLKTLILYRAPYTAQLYGPFLAEYSLEGLRTLSLSGPILSNLSFLRRMPNLELLEIDAGVRPNFVARKYTQNHLLGIIPLAYTGDIMAATRSSSLSNVVLTKLKKIYISNEFTEQSIERLSDLAPNIQIMSMKLNNISFSAVCKCWPNLEKLELLKGSAVDDCGITGFECHQLDHYRGNVAFCKCCCACPTMAEKRKERGFADITFLKKLREFRATEEQMGILTEHCVLQGFLWLPGSVFIRLRGATAPLIVAYKVGSLVEITFTADIDDLLDKLTWRKVVSLSSNLHSCHLENLHL